MIHTSWRGLAAAALLVVAGSARAAEGVADPSPPDSLSPDELRRIEESLGADAAATPPLPAATPPAPSGSGLSNPDLSVILDAAGAWFSTDEPLQLGGHDPGASGFNFQQLELAIGASADPFFRFDANLVFSPFGVEVEEAYASTLALPASLQVRAGQFLTRFGRINPTHPHTWAFVDQPLVIGKFFGAEGSRGVGVEGSWLAPLPWFVEVVGSANDAAGEANARSFFGAENLGVKNPGDLLYTTALKQFFPLGEDLGVLWGLSAQFGPNPTGNGNRTAIVGTDLLLRYRPVASTDRAALTLQVEGLHRARQVPGDSLRDFGGYGQLVWSIDPEWETGLRYEHVSGLEDDPLDPAWIEARRRASAQVTYYPSHFSRIRLQVNRDDPTFRDQAFWAAFLNLELVVGAHGSHAY